MSNAILGALTQSQSDVLHRVIRNTFIVEMGIIKEILDDGRVSVISSAAIDSDNVKVYDCVLANLASSSLAVSVKPNVNDKVIVLFPRNYVGKMFSTKEEEPIITPATAGYCVTGGIAILLNQFNEDSYNNIVKAEDGKIEIKLDYSDNENKFIFTTDGNGSAELDCKEINIKNDKASIDVDSSGNITVNSGKAEIKVDGTTGNVTIDAKNGKVEIKNNLASLYDILNGLLQALNTEVTVTTNTGSGVITPAQFVEELTKLNLIMQ